MASLRSSAIPGRARVAREAGGSPLVALREPPPGLRLWVLLRGPHGGGSVERGVHRGAAGCLGRGAHGRQSDLHPVSGPHRWQYRRHRDRRRAAVRARNDPGGDPVASLAQLAHQGHQVCGQRRSVRYRHGHVRSAHLVARLRQEAEHRRRVERHLGRPPELVPQGFRGPIHTPAERQQLRDEPAAGLSDGSGRRRLEGLARPEGGAEAELRL